MTDEKENKDEVVEKTEKVEFIPKLPDNYIKETEDIVEKVAKIEPDKVETVSLEPKRNNVKITQNLFYRIPVLGNILMKKWVNQGAIIAEIIMPSQNVQRYIIFMTQDFIEIEVNKIVRFYDVSDLRSHQERYVKFENGVPVVTFFWDYPKPIPIKPIKTEVINMDTFGLVVLRERSRAAAEPIRQFLQEASTHIKIAMIASGISAIGSFIIILQTMGILK